MHNTMTIFRRELAAYFNSPVAYVIIIAFLVVCGAIFWPQAFAVGEASLRGFFGVNPLILIFFAPPISMRLLAEERRSGTIALLFTLPVKDWEVVLGKFLASLGVFAAGLLLTVAYPITLAQFGDIDWGTVVAGYIGLLLLGGAYMAVGLMASAFTRHQVVAMITSLAILLFLFLMGQLLPFVPRSLAPVIEYISINSHFTNIARGVIDTRDLVYYLSLIGGCLFIAAQSLDSRRWRG